MDTKGDGVGSDALTERVLSVLFYMKNKSLF